MTKPHLDKASPFLVPQEDYPPSQSVQRNFIAPPFPLFLSPRGSSPVLLYLPSRHCVWSSSVLVGFWSIVLPLSGFPCASAIFPANLPTNTRKKKLFNCQKHTSSKPPIPVDYTRVRLTSWLSGLGSAISRCPFHSTGFIVPRGHRAAGTGCKIPPRPQLGSSIPHILS